MITSNIFTKGINQDSHPKFQPEGTYRFALNAVLETELGEMPSISNELGNSLTAADYPSGKTIIGHTPTDNEDIILLLYDPLGDHEIGVFDPLAKNYTSIATGSCLNFSDKYPVNVLFRIRNGCERVIYFTDNYNPYRVANLTDTSEWVSEGTITDCEKILYSPPYQIPCISLYVGEGDIGVVDHSGYLKVGTYYFAIRYLDKELNPTDYFLITRPIAVGDELFNNTESPSTVSLYDGGSNTDNSPYFVNPTNKSIKLRLTNLDFQSYAYFQLAVVKRTGDAGEIEGVDVLTTVPMSSQSHIFTYTGQDNQILTSTSIDELLSSKTKIDKVAAHAQKDSRLYLANANISSYDYSTFQRYASKIKTEWSKDDISSAVDAFNKQPGYYFLNSSFMEDEVYALGIVYVMEDGSFSPVFHIPGRAADTNITGSNPLIGVDGVADDGGAWDTSTLTTYGNFFNFAKTKRWQQISTATKYSSGPFAGLMGFHEAITATYPDITPCYEHEDGYWGRDWQDNLIEAGTTKLRHHRMPGPEIKTPSATEHGARVGIRFSNVEYPPNAIGHYFVYADRDTDKTILAKGALIPLYSIPDYQEDWEYSGDSQAYVFNADSLRPRVIGVHPFPSPEDIRTFAFICSEGLLKDRQFDGGIFRVEKIYRDGEYDVTGGTDNEASTNVVLPAPYYDNFAAHMQIWGMGQYEIPESQNYTISYTAKIPKANVGDVVGPIIDPPSNGHRVRNDSVNISPQIIVLNRQITDHLNNGEETWPNKILYGSIKIDVDPYINLYQLKYHRMTNCLHTNASTSTVNTVYGGDTFNSRLGVLDYRYTQSDEDGKNVTASYLNFLTQDSGVNYEFRHGALDPIYSYFQWNYQYLDGGGFNILSRYLATKYYEEEDGVMLLHPEQYAYNDSFSYLKSLEVYLPLPFNYDLCGSCTEYFPYRVFYSEMDNQELSEDNYRIIKTNNYRDLDGSTGPITDLFTSFEQLYALTPRSAYLLPTQPQTIQSNEASIYIGTGEVLAIPPRQLKTSSNAFGGTNYFKSRILTEYGAFYVDDISSRPFLLSNQLNDLSNNGLRNFWQEHGQLEFTKQFRLLTNIEFPIKSTSSPIGVGYISTYDPRYKRILVHKRDFKITPTYSSSFAYEDLLTDDDSANTTPSILWFNNFNFYINDGDGNSSVVSFNDINYFENKSFTLSYSFLTNSWISFHSYLPAYLFSGDRNFYSSATDSIYEHNTGEYQTYYNLKYEHIIDLIASQTPTLQSTLTNVLYNSNVYEYDADTNSFKNVDATYSNLIAYNSSQSTGKLNLAFNNESFPLDEDPLTAYVKRVDRQYRINNLRDASLSHLEPIWDSSWTSIASQPFQWIDKNPNNVNIDQYQSLFESKRLKDHYLGLRFFFNPRRDYKITTDIINTQHVNRNR